jgi:hypothetical protein
MSFLVLILIFCSLQLIYSWELQVVPLLGESISPFCNGLHFNERGGYKSLPTMDVQGCISSQLRLSLRLYSLYALCDVSFTTEICSAFPLEATQSQAGLVNVLSTSYLSLYLNPIGTDTNFLFESIWNVTALDAIYTTTCNGISNPICESSLFSVPGSSSLLGIFQR